MTPSNPYSPNEAVGDKELPGSFDCSGGAATTVTTITSGTSVCSVLGYINHWLVQGPTDGSVSGPIRLAGTELYFEYTAAWHNLDDQPVLVDVYINALDLGTCNQPSVDAIEGRFGVSFMCYPYSGLRVVDPNVVFDDANQGPYDFDMSPPRQIGIWFPVHGDEARAHEVASAFSRLLTLLKERNPTEYEAHVRKRKNEASSVQAAESASLTSQPAPETSGTDASTSGWQEDHRERIQLLEGKITAHEEQAQQDDADAEQAQAQVRQNESANVSGPGGGYLALGNAVQGAMSAGLAARDRQQADEERRQAQEEREQLAELGAEQPPVAQNESESIALTRMQTQMIRSGNTVEGALNTQENDIREAQERAREERERLRAQREEQARRAQLQEETASRPPPPQQSPVAAGTTQDVQSGSSGGQIATQSDSCTNMNGYVTAKVWLGHDGIVAGSLTNTSSQPISVHYTFAKGGQADPNQVGVLTLRPGQTVGGEMSGIESPSSFVDVPPRIFWSAVLAADADKACGMRNPW